MLQEREPLPETSKKLTIFLSEVKAEKKDDLFGGMGSKQISGSKRKKNRYILKLQATAARCTETSPSLIILGFIIFLRKVTHSFFPWNIRGLTADKVSLFIINHKDFSLYRKKNL